MFRRHLPMKDVIALEDWNRFAAIFDIDGMSWSDRCARCDDAKGFDVEQLQRECPARSSRGSCRFDTLMRYNTVLIKHGSCCHDFFTHRLQAGVHYLVNSCR